MRITLLVILALVFCTGCKRPADYRMERFAETARQTVNPTELETWAAMVISNTPPERRFTSLPTNGVPKGVRDLMTNYGTLKVMVGGPSNDVVLVYMRGSGFGHWGFAAGGPTYTCGFGHTQSYWTNGIWFWTE
jgi:hypothetical protein